MVLGFKGFRVSGFQNYRSYGFRVLGLVDFRVWGFRVLGFRVLGLQGSGILSSKPQSPANSASPQAYGSA